MRVLNSLSDLNVMRILRLIYLEKKISRVDIASRLAMDKSTVTKITSELCTKNLIREAEVGNSGPQGGRKPVFLELNGQYAAIGGIEINSEHFYALILNLSGNLIFEYTEKINPDEYLKIGFMGFFKKALSVIKKHAEKINIRLLGIGVGVPSLVDYAEGKIINSIPLMIYKPVEFTKEASKIAKIPVFIDNDARCCCYTEKSNCENSAREKNMMYVMIQYRQQKPVKGSQKDISVGFGFKLGGKVYRGTNSLAGEFRSMMWNPESKNQFSNSTNYIEDLSDTKKINPLFKELAKNVAFIVNLLNLDIVYAGGIDEKYTTKIVQYIREEILYLWPYEKNACPDIKTSEPHDRVVSEGAALMVLDRLFSVPEFSDNMKQEVLYAALWI
ncbi:MAG: ROK family transcriptional regulator [Treponema sp.]|nr:ROK family transcriptional regulator [Treponema sp.]